MLVRVVFWKALGCVFIGLAIWRLIVFLWPSNGVTTLPGEMMLFIMVAWCCFLVANRKP